MTDAIANPEFDIDDFRKNVIGAMGDNAIAMSALVRVSSIIPDKTIPTAYISLEGVPEIHVNPSFIAEHAQTPEHQFILVYHELMHMILRHGAKVKSEKDNILADALINSMICMQYPQSRYTRFFTNFYDAKEFPQNLLRPFSKFKKFSHRQKYRRLYSYFGISWDDLNKLFEELEEESDSSGKDGYGTVLLGNHDNLDGNNGHGDEIVAPIAERLEHAIRDEINREVRNQERKIQQKHYRRCPVDYDKMEEELKACREQGFSSSVFITAIDSLKSRMKKHREIEKILIEHAQQSISSKIETALKGMFPKIPLMTAIPNLRDRAAIVAEDMGMYKPFFKNPLLPKDYGVCSIYVDVSGSMGSFVRLVYRVATDCQDYLDDKIYLFSNIIEPITKGELTKGIVKSTGGTDFDIIIDHMNKNHVKKAVIFTDGYASINQQSLNIIKKNQLKIISVVTPGGTGETLKHFVTKSISIDSNGDVR